ncbi:MAG: T9SS type A sorting domain-containing protein [Brumimicrobium sp.]|nr:T9SS type A sorting domain-containing protein [Brumimicrobium sp.]
MKKNYITITLLFLALTSFGQVSFTEITGTSFPPLAEGEAEFFDIDNDSDLDLIISGSAGFNMMTIMEMSTTNIYINDGDGNFSLFSGSTIDSVAYSSIAIGDIDNDLDEDIFICGQDISGTYISKIYTNDGTGNFTLTTNSIIGTVQGDAEFGDIDGDNDLDLIISGYTGSGYNTSLYVNDGSGSFSLVSGTPFSGTNYASVKFFDMDNDNDLDVVLAGTNGSITFTELYSNDGNGTYTLVTGTPFSGSQLGSIDIADVDNDSDLDVLISGYDGSTEFIELYNNDGSGNFVLNTGSSFTGVAYSSVQFADFDIDGDMDIISCGYNGITTNRYTKLYLNDGTGIYTELTSVSFPGNQQFRVRAADIDGDTDPDFFLSGSSDGGQPDNAVLYRNNFTSLSVFENQLFPKLNIYPNPFEDKFSVDLGSSFHSVKIQITDISGRLIQSTEYKDSQLLHLNLNQPSGIYLLFVETAEFKNVIQLVKH